MAKGTDEEFQETQERQRDERLLAAVRGITTGLAENRTAVEKLMRQNADGLERLVRAFETQPEPVADDNAGLAAEIKPLISEITTGIAEVAKLLRERPTRYRIKRDAMNFIQEVIAE